MRGQWDHLQGKGTTKPALNQAAALCISFPAEQLHSPTAQAGPAGAKKNPGVLQVLLNIDIQFTMDGWKQLGDGAERRIACWLLYQAGTRGQAACGCSGWEEHLWPEWPSVWKAIFPGCSWILTQPNCSEMQWTQNWGEQLGGSRNNPRHNQEAAALVWDLHFAHRLAKRMTNPLDAQKNMCLSYTTAMWMENELLSVSLGDDIFTFCSSSLSRQVW